MPMAAEVGAKAPDFTLTNQDRQPVTVSAERGHGGAARMPAGIVISVVSAMRNAGWPR